MGPIAAAAVGSLVSAVAGAVIQSATNDNGIISYPIMNSIDRGINSLYKRYQWNHGGKIAQSLNQSAINQRLSNYFSNTFKGV